MVGMMLVGILWPTTTRHCGGSGRRGDGWDGVGWHSFANKQLHCIVMVVGGEGMVGMVLVAVALAL